jgi:hypothetical protein
MGRTKAAAGLALVPAGGGDRGGVGEPTSAIGAIGKRMFPYKPQLNVLDMRVYGFGL